MTKYRNRGGDSGIEAYEIFTTGIHVRFNNGSTYEYNYRIPGQPEVEKMKTLASVGEGLNEYIKKHIGSRFARKW